MAVKSNVVIQRCGWHTVSVVLLNHHYLHRIPAGIIQCYAMTDADNFMIVLGAAVFTNGGIQYDGRFLTFARLWVDDRMGKNSESMMISHCMRDLAKSYPKYEGVVTWADPKQGHNGTIYKASNFIYDGESRRTKRYRHATTGRMVYQRTVTDESMYVAVDDDGSKKRFIYYFDKRKRERERQQTKETKR